MAGFSLAKSLSVSTDLCCGVTLISSGFGNSVGSVRSFFGDFFVSGSVAFNSSGFLFLSS